MVTMTRQYDACWKEFDLISVDKYLTTYADRHGTAELQLECKMI